MKVLFISANTETINMIPLPLGLNCVAVATRDAGHEIRLIDLMGSTGHESIIGDAVREFDPEVIGISIRNVDDQKMLETKFLLEPVKEAVTLCRKFSRAPIVIGGAAYGIFPESVLRYTGADMGICGEGEMAFPALLDALSDGIPPKDVPGLLAPSLGLRNQAPLRSDPDILPFADPSLWHVPDQARQEIWIPFQTRRGCPMKCSYCSTAALEGTVIRTRSIPDTLKNLADHVAAGFDRFYFVDNVFNFPVAYAKSFCTALRDSGLKIEWRAILYPGFVDEELVEAMAKAGCVEVSLGFESGCDRILRNMNKKYTTADVRAASTLLGKHGIRRMGFLLLGGPGETNESVEESLSFAESLNLDMLKVSGGIRIYPDTALEKTAREEGIIAPDDDLLMPRFYMAPGLGEWLESRIREWVAERPYCIT